METEKLLVSKVPLDNRREKRRFLFDCEVIMPDLIAIELRFADDLFNDANASYRDLYRFYLDQFRVTCAMMLLAKRRHLSSTMINHDYWAKVYGPVEGGEND
jgi:hypothetical protein